MAAWTRGHNFLANRVWRPRNCSPARRGFIGSGIKGHVPWTVFARQLVEKVIEDHKLPQALAKFMPEDRRSFIQDVMEELVGLRPPSWVISPKIAETVLSLADAGHVILVGRGANFITARMPNVSRVRLIGVAAETDRAGADKTRFDPGRSHQVRQGRGSQSEPIREGTLSQSVDDDLFYHLILNTDRIPLADAAQLIGDGARRCFGWSGDEQKYTPDGSAIW